MQAHCILYISVYGLDDRGSKLSRAWNFLLRHRVQTGSGAHLAFYPTDTGDSFARCEAAGAWSWPHTSI